MNLEEVKVSLPNRPNGDHLPVVSLESVVVQFPENASLTRPASREVEAVVAAMREQMLMAEGYAEMADETLALAREARAAQIRALPQG
jgi:hypothetical protein